MVDDNDEDHENIMKGHKTCLQQLFMMTKTKSDLGHIFDVFSLRWIRIYCTIDTKNYFLDLFCGKVLVNDNDEDHENIMKGDKTCLQHIFMMTKIKSGF